MVPKTSRTGQFTVTQFNFFGVPFFQVWRGEISPLGSVSNYLLTKYHYFHKTYTCVYSKPTGFGSFWSGFRVSNALHDALVSYFPMVYDTGHFGLIWESQACGVYKNIATHKNIGVRGGHSRTFLIANLAILKHRFKQPKPVKHRKLSITNK